MFVSREDFRGGLIPCFFNGIQSNTFGIIWPLCSFPGGVSWWLCHYCKHLNFLEYQIFFSPPFTNFQVLLVLFFLYNLPPQDSFIGPNSLLLLSIMYIMKIFIYRLFFYDLHFIEDRHYCRSIMQIVSYIYQTNPIKNYFLSWQTSQCFLD